MKNSAAAIVSSLLVLSCALPVCAAAKHVYRDADSGFSVQTVNPVMEYASKYSYGFQENISATDSLTSIAAIPFIMGGKGLSTCFETVVSPALIMGAGAFISIRFLFWYFYSYVWDLVERERRTRAYAEFDASVKTVDHKIWMPGRDDNIRKVFRLLWVLVPLVLVQGLCTKVPQVAQFMQPLNDWFAAISSTEWSYIAGVCALKVIIIWASRRWEWKFVVEKSAILLLATVTLAFAIWPLHLPDGMALKSGMDQVLPYVALPVRFLGLAVYWPVWIGLWALGFVGRMAVSLVLWIISLFM